MLGDRLLHCLARIVSAGFCKVDFRELPDLFLGRHRFVLGPIGIEFRVTHEPGIRALKPEKAGVHALWHRSGEIELLPKLIQLSPASLIENEVVEWPIIPEITGHAVQTSAEQTSCIF